MLGVAVVNVYTFNRGFNVGTYGWDAAVNHYDKAAELISNLFFAHRSIPVLCFLLGVGLVVQSQKFPPTNVSGGLYKRYIALGLIGMVHGLFVWPGEILTAYALLVLILGRYAVVWRAHTLAWVVALLFLAIFGGEIYFAATDHSPISCAKDDFLGPSSFLQHEWIAARRRGAVEYVVAGVLQALVPQIWLLLLLGVWAGRCAFFWAHLKSPNLRHPVVIASALLLLIAGAVEYKTGVAGAWSSLHCSGRAASMFDVAQVTTMVAVVPVVLTVFAALCNRVSQAGWLARLIAVGRAPITMFLSQSVVFALLFNQTYLGLHEKLGRAAVLAIALLTYFVLAAWIDQCFIRHGRIAPGERFWRWLTAKLGG